MLEHCRYGSKHAALRIDAQGPDPILHPVTGSIVGHKRGLVAEFGILGDEYVARDEHGDPLYRDQMGAPYVSVDIRGHHWDSQVAQEMNNWTDDETMAVLAQVDYFCRTQPDLVWKLETPRFALPWPTYDGQNPKNIVAFAIEGGLAQEALAYERQNENRPQVVKELEAHLAERTDSAEAEDALTAA